MDIQFFNPKEEYSVVWRKLPHWAQAGTVCFITWRAADSMPRDVVRRWMTERDALLRQHGIAPGPSWKAALDKLPLAVQQRLKWTLTERWDNCLDECHGACVLKQPELADIVDKSLRHFDGDRYVMTDFVIMPNHAHLLAAFPTPEAMGEQCAAWRRYTARRINQQLQQRGEFWQDEGFDHLVRSPEHFEYYRRYIAENPIKAHLRPGEYRLYSRV
jgi:REP element-mobilizing transposase RayT